MKIYISIPITGCDINQQKRHASIHKTALELLGHQAVTPFEIVPDSDKPYSYCMGRDIEALLECDAIYLCDGWENSRGCQLEVQAAKIYGKKIFQTDTPLDKFK